ncbi:MAG: preprotein translocase subunit SecE [Omnitrophica WOR_2 bacterium RIFCSPLOWO2_12_FULL_51_8]|nr:MAG: preprotein translocase subunit SecE [Omnitrophica WOR_2 bacterium RIFCSPLOWO2_12_FULL_51_8]
MHKPVNFLKEVKVELGKVSWSTREELIASTFVVITATAMMTLFIFVIDYVLSGLLGMLFK